jgi:hypothetical protein
MGNVRPPGAKARGKQPDLEVEVIRTLVKTEAMSVDTQTVRVRYFELRTLRGARRYSAEIVLGPGDRVILDDDSVMNLETRATRLVPATVYSRLLAGRATAAA